MTDRENQVDGDMVVSRVNGSSDMWVVGEIAIDPTSGRRILKDIKSHIGQSGAIKAAYDRLGGADSMVWLVPGKEPHEVTYFRAPRPAN